MAGNAASERLLIRRASLSRCKTYRYSLVRQWGRGGTVVIVGLNPSTADARIDDPTVRRCIGFAASWGFGRLVLINLFAFRATDPARLHCVDDPIGPMNNRCIRRQVGEADLVLVAWGNRGNIRDRDKAVLAWLPNPHCIGVTGQGFPRHPLYVRSDATPTKFAI
jgi:hypothetical protein